MKKISYFALIINIMLFAFPIAVLGLETDLVESNKEGEKQVEIIDNVEEEKDDIAVIDNENNDINLTIISEEEINQDLNNDDNLNSIESQKAEDIETIEQDLNSEEQLLGLNENKENIELSSKSLNETRNVSSSSSELTPQNDIPLVIIRVDESEEAINSVSENDPEHEYGTIEEMNASEHHTVRSIGTIEIVLPEGYVGEYNLSNSPVGEQKLSYVRGRGNSTWMISNKKPYKIKYDKKQDVLGMGKNKEWGLLANSFDPTLVHNDVMSWLGEEMEMEYTSKMVPVDLVMIGSESGYQFLGNYYLSELVDIGKERVDINELDEDEQEDITGGYLLSIYYEPQDFKEPDNTVFETEYSKVKLINENPYFDEAELTSGQKAQQEYIRDYVNRIDDLIMNGDLNNENVHNELGELLDLKSTADFYLIQEFFVNFDGYKTSSNYLYKKTNDKLYWGPLWDFDLMLYLLDAEIPSQVVGFNKVQSFPWLDELRSRDPYFVELLKEEWNVLDEKLNLLIQDNGVLDSYKENIRNSWDKNYEIYKESVYFDNETTIDKEFNDMITIIKNRQKWFNENIDKISKVYSNVRFVVDDEIVEERNVYTYELMEPCDIKPKKDGYLFNGWINEETKESMDYKKILGDTIMVPDYIKQEDISEKIDIFFSKYNIWVDLQDDEFCNNELKVFPEDYYDLIINNMEFTSSNENIATVEENGIVYLHSVGQAIITAKLFNGSKVSYTLNVYDENQEFDDDPKEVIFEKEEYTLEVGENVQIKYDFVSEKPIDPYIYINASNEIDDENIITVDYSDNYVITGLKEGETYISITLYNSDLEYEIISKRIKIIVTPKKEDTSEDNSSSDNENNNQQENNNQKELPAENEDNAKKDNNTSSNQKDTIIKINNSTNSTISDESENNGSIIDEPKQEDNNQINDNNKEEKQNNKKDEIVKDDEKKESNNLPIWIISSIFLLTLLGVALFAKRKKEEE